MNAHTQIIVLLTSFIFGYIFYYLYKINFKIITKEKYIYRSITTILFMLNIVLLYTIILYKLNNGKFHIYFFIMIVLGFISNIKITKLMLNNVKFISYLEKYKQKWYTIKNRRNKNEKESN